MIIKDIISNKSQVVFIAEIQGKVNKVTFDFDQPLSTDLTTFDSAVLSYLLPGMANRESLTVEGPVSEGLIENIEKWQTWLKGYHPNLSRVNIQPQSVVSTTPSPGAIQTYSGGLDSIYTLLQSDPQACVFVPEYNGNLLGKRQLRELISLIDKSMKNKTGTFVCFENKFTKFK